MGYSIPNFFRKHSTASLLFLLTIIGAIARLLLAARAGSFWFDEAFSVHFASMPLRDMVSYLLYEHHPLAHFTLLHYWIQFFGDSEFVTRLLSVIFGTLAIPLGYFTGKKFFNTKIGLFTALFITFSSFQIFHSAQARMYEMFFFFTLLSLYTFLKWYKKQSTKHITLYVISTALLIHTHIFGLFIPIAVNIFLLYERFIFKSGKHTRWMPWLTGQFILGIAYLAWLIPMLSHKLSQNLGSAWFFNQELPQFFLTRYLQDFFFIGNSLIFPLEALLGILLVLTLLATLARIHLETLASWSIQWSTTPQIRLLWTLVIISFIPALALHLDNRPQYFMTAAAVVYILVAMGITRLLHKEQYIIWISIGITIVLIGSTGSILLTTPIFNTAQLAQTIEQQEKADDIIILHSFMTQLPFDRYYQGSLPVYGFYPLEDTNDQNLRYILHNWHPIATMENVNKLSSLTKDVQRIFLVYYVTGQIDHQELVKNWLLLHNWRIVETYTYPGPIDLPVLVLEKENNTNPL